MLYSWDELTSSELDESSIELRLVESETGVQQNEMGMYGCPLESLAAAGLDSEALASLVQKVKLLCFSFIYLKMFLIFHEN